MCYDRNTVFMGSPFLIKIYICKFLLNKFNDFNEHLEATIYPIIPEKYKLCFFSFKPSTKCC